jgi:hypothetical protein
VAPEMTASPGPWLGTRLHVWFYQIIYALVHGTGSLSFVNLEWLVVDSRPSTPSLDLNVI